MWCIQDHNSIILAHQCVRNPLDAHLDFEYGLSFLSWLDGDELFLLFSITDFCSFQLNSSDVAVTVCTVCIDMTNDYPKRLTVYSGYTFISMCFLGIEPTTFCAANAMLYHWATGTYDKQNSLKSRLWVMFLEFRCWNLVPFLPDRFPAAEEFVVTFDLFFV